MKLWVQKETLENPDDGIGVVLEAPDSEEEEDFWLFTTQEEHYYLFVSMLEAMAEEAREVEDYRKEHLCLELSGRFKSQIPHSKAKN